MATGSGAGRIQKAQDQEADAKLREREARMTGKAVMTDPKTGKDTMYDTRRDSADREWLYKEGTQPKPRNRT